MKRSLILATAIFSTIFSSVSQAETWAEACGPIFSSTFELQGRIEMSRSIQDVLPSSEYARSILRVDGLLGELIIPRGVPITIGKGFIFSSFDTVRQQVFVGIRPQEMGFKNPAVNIHTLNHEYGHAIFEMNLLQRSPEFRLFREKYIQNEKEIDVLQMEINRLENEVNVKPELQETVVKLKAQLKLMKKQHRAELGKYNFTSGLHEIFADLTAVIAAKDPRAIEKIARKQDETYKAHSSDTLKLRDFSEGEHHLSRQRWQKEHPFYAQFAGDVYYAFLPVRWEIWSLIKTRMHGAEYEKALLGKVFTILQKHLESGLQNPQKLGSKGFDSIDLINQQIIQDLRQIL